MTLNIVLKLEIQLSKDIKIRLPEDLYCYKYKPAYMESLFLIFFPYVLAKETLREQTQLQVCFQSKIEVFQCCYK